MELRIHSQTSMVQPYIVITKAAFEMNSYMIFLFFYNLTEANYYVLSALVVDEQCIFINKTTNRRDIANG